MAMKKKCGTPANLRVMREPLGETATGLTP
jgi:hypothetical protein